MGEEENIEQSTNDSPQPTENNDTVFEPTTINEQPRPTGSSGRASTENMEVHKHPHHITHKKKWTEYLLEFFMLFFAVFLGFIAENIREHIVENDREKQFIQSLVNDITADTARIRIIINERNKREQKLDSLSFLLNNDSSATNTNRIYFYSTTASRTLSFRFVPNDGTMQQLKNSGALRLIRNHIVADSIAKYDVTVRNILKQSELEENIIADYRLASAQIFDALVFDRMVDANNNVRMLTENPALLPYQKSDLYSWNYKMYGMKALNKANRRDARLLLQQAVNLLNTLKKGYHLK